MYKGKTCKLKDENPEFHFSVLILNFEYIHSEL